MQQGTFLTPFPHILNINSDTTLSFNQDGGILILADASSSDITIDISYIRAGNPIAIKKIDTSTNTVTIAGLASATLTPSTPTFFGIGGENVIISIL